MLLIKNTSLTEGKGTYRTAAGTRRENMAGLVDRQNGEKHIGCMSSFLQIFHRQQILARKRIHSAKRLHFSADVGASPETVSSGELPEFYEELGKPEKRVVVVVPARPDDSELSPAENENGRPTVNGDGVNQSQTPGVIAKLMGLEPLSSSGRKTQTANTTPALPRSASESRVSRDLGHSKYIDGNNFQLKQPKQTQKQSKSRSMENWKSECSRTAVMMHVDFEKRLKIRGIDEQLNDLNTLKQILEVLQFKGLLHSTNRDSYRNYHSDESSIHLKQWQSLASKVEQHRSVNNSGSGRTPIISRTVSSNRIESNLKSCKSIIKRKPLSIVTIDSAPSTTVSERSRWEDCRDGKRLLERCGNLLQSIAEMNRTTESPPSSMTVLPSPVSVLDSGFDKDESSSPSHSTGFKATSTVDLEEENSSPKISPAEQEEFISDDSDFIYISEILRASQPHRDDSTVFFSIEKQFYDSDNASTVSKRHRRLVFDVIFEILDRNRQLPPWKTSFEDSRASVKQIWCEFQKTQEMIINTGSLVELISCVLKKDIVEVKDWEEYPIERSEVIRDAERLIFKDLVSEAIRDVGEFSSECKFSRSRRKLVF